MSPPPADFPRARCHGDLVWWNAGRSGRRVALWDWEYSFPDAPLGFDLLQGRYRMYRESGWGVGDALRKANAEAERPLGALGLDRHERSVVTAIHGLDAAVRIGSRIDVPGTSTMLAREALDACPVPGL